MDGVTSPYRSMLLSVLMAVPLAVANAQHGSPPKLDALIETIRAEVHPQDAMERMRRIYSTDRWFTFSKFQQTADYLKSVLTDIGLDHIEMLAAPADGVSQFGFWTEPMAWDVKQAKLEIIQPAVPGDQATLADFEKVPTSLGMWSGPTPPEGVVAEIVELADTS